MTQKKNNNDGLIYLEDAPLTVDLYSLQGSDLLNWVLEDNDPPALVQNLPDADFFWLVKRIGDDDSLPVLQLATTEQWQYLLDMELWERDRINIKDAAEWFQRLATADPDRLTGWIRHAGREFAYYYFQKSIRTAIYSEEEKPETIPDDFFTLDGVFYIKVLDESKREAIKIILTQLADDDYKEYQALLLELSTRMPAELEEDLYRLRNTRLSEHGFLPFEEAIALYAPLSSDQLTCSGDDAVKLVPTEEQADALIPMLPVFQMDKKSFFSRVLHQINDPLVYDRLMLEFAALGNQLLTADMARLDDFESVAATCRKAAGYINAALEKSCGTDVDQAARLLACNTINDLFRVGYGLALKTKIQAENWIRSSWYKKQGLTNRYWGDYWEGMLNGLLTKRPQYHSGEKGADEYRGFETIDEIAECMKNLLYLMVLDRLMKHIAGGNAIPAETDDASNVTVHSHLFTFWLRKSLNLEPGIKPVSLAEGKAFLAQLREGQSSPPYHMQAWKKEFIDFTAGVFPDEDPKAAAVLVESAVILWDEFRKEYENVDLDKLVPRYSRFLLLE